MQVIAYKTTDRDGKVLLEESTGDSLPSDNIVDLFTFLVEEFEDKPEDYIQVTWNLDITVSLFLRLLGEVKCLQLKEKKRCHLAPFDVFYIPEKVFSVVHIPTRTKCNLYGLEQYFPELEEPELNEVKTLGELLLAELKKMGLEPTKLTSPVAVYEECVMRDLDLPKLKDIPQGAAEFAYRAAGRLWIESHTLGMFGQIHDYDLISAFPNIAKDLIDTRSCYWKKSKSYQKNALYGYVKCKITIFDWVMVHPIIRETEEGCDSPVGTWEAYLTKGELDFIDKWKIGEYEILDGWWCIPIKGRPLKKPLLEPMTKLLSYKQGTELQKLIAKRASTGIYGRFGEDRGDEFGPYFFPPYFAEISTEDKLQVGEFLYQRGIGPRNNRGYKTLLHIGVDGTELTKEVSINGTWRLDYIGPVLIWSSGLVYTNTTKPKGLTLKEVLAMVKRYPKRPYYQKTLKRRLTLADSLARHRLADIGKEVEFSVSLNLINPLHDRRFSKLPETGGQLLGNKYRSKPRKV